MLTGKKGTQKFYRTHSGWVGGLKETPYRILMKEQPQTAMRVAVRGMLPKNSLSRASLSQMCIRDRSITLSAEKLMPPIGPLQINGVQKMCIRDSPNAPYTVRSCPFRTRI